MALKNLEEAIVDRIQRALAPELKRLRLRSRPGNGRRAPHLRRRKAEAMGGGSGTNDNRGGSGGA